MSESVQRYHGLEGFLDVNATFEPGSAGVQVSLREPLDYVNLRGDPETPEFLATVPEYLGQNLPLEANTFTEGAHRIYWLGPDEWLLATQYGLSQGLPGVMVDQVHRNGGAVTIVTGGFVTLRIGGENSGLVLAKGCTLDIHAQAFLPGSCAQSGLAKAPVLIACIKTSVFDVVVRRSFTDYLGHWLKQAGAEYGVTFVS